VTARYEPRDDVAHDSRCSSIIIVIDSHACGSIHKKY
jgi:hypothetical protein